MLFDLIVLKALDTIISSHLNRFSFFRLTRNILKDSVMVILWEGDWLIECVRVKREGKVKMLLFLFLVSSFNLCLVLESAAFWLSIMFFCHFSNFWRSFSAFQEFSIANALVVAHFSFIQLQFMNSMLPWLCCYSLLCFCMLTTFFNQDSKFVYFILAFLLITHCIYF